MRLSDLKSHSTKEVEAALASGIPVWHLDTAGTDGDDFLIGLRFEVEEEIRNLFVCDSLPQGWTLVQITMEEWREVVIADQ